MQVRPGLFLGGAEGLCEGVNKNEIVPESVRWFCRSDSFPLLALRQSDICTLIQVFFNMFFAAN